MQGLSARLVRDVARVLQFRLYGEEPPPAGSDFVVHDPQRSLADVMIPSTALVEQLRVFRDNPDVRAWVTPGAQYKWGYRWEAHGFIADGSQSRWHAGVSARNAVRQAAILETRQRIRWNQRVEQVQSGRRMWHALAGLPRKVETTAPSPSSHPTHMATKIKLLAKDGKEFEVEKDVACLSETVSASTDQIATNTGHHINWVRATIPTGWRKRNRY